MNLHIIAGGMSGAEEGALDAASDIGTSYSGWMASGYRVLGGTRKDIGMTYGLEQTTSANLSDRTRLMVHEADLVLFFGKEKLRWFRTVSSYAEGHCPVETVNPDYDCADWVAAILIATHGAQNIFVTGDRDDRRPGIKEKTKAIMLKVLNEQAKQRSSSENPESAETVSPLPEMRGQAMAEVHRIQRAIKDGSAPGEGSTLHSQQRRQDLP